MVFTSKINQKKKKKKKKKKAISIFLTREANNNE